MTIINNSNVCPTCNHETLKYYDKVKRIVRSKNGTTKWISVPRFKCSKCGSYHRKLPDTLLPFKHYEADVIRGVREQLITPCTYEYEDYPCEMTMKRWVLYE